MPKLMTGDELKIIRNLLGLTCQEAGDLMFLTKQTISNLENGRCKQKSSLYLMQLCYQNYCKEHEIDFPSLIKLKKDELEESIRRVSDLGHMI